MTYEGISASPGVAIGRAFIYDNGHNLEIEKFLKPSPTISE